MDIVPLAPSIGQGVLSLSAEALQHHSAGGSPQFHYLDEVIAKSHTVCFKRTSPKGVIVAVPKKMV